MVLEGVRVVFGGLRGFLGELGLFDGMFDAVEGF